MLKNFIEFAAKNRKLLGEGKEDLFLQNLKTTFNLRSAISRVIFLNSGNTNFHRTNETTGIDDLTFNS